MLPQNLWACSCALYRSGWPRLALAIKTLNWALFKCLLPFEAVVGKGLRLEHYALGVVVHPQVTIGDDCRVYHHVTLASESPIGSPHRITIGNHATLGAHSIVVARAYTSLRIGHNSVLGAGSVLLTDIPDNEVWAGNPARKIKDRPSSFSPLLDTTGLSR